MISSRRFNAVSKSGAGAESVPSAIRRILADCTVYFERPMKIVPLVAAAALCLTSACAPGVEPAVDHATVVAAHASVRLKNSSTSRTLKVLEPGDKIDILEQQEHWYKIRLGRMQGWMEEST